MWVLGLRKMGFILFVLSLRGLGSIEEDMMDLVRWKYRFEVRWGLGLEMWILL